MIQFDNNLLNFLSSKRVYSLATFDQGSPWICNVFMAFDENLKKFIFFSSPDSKHSKQIAVNSEVAFATWWFDDKNPKNRKGIQAQGKCFRAGLASDSEREILDQYIETYINKVSDGNKWITVEDYIVNKSESKIYIVEPTYIKYWDDELFNDNKFCEYSS